MFVCHTCDNRKCINPNHLWIGTRQENIQDASKKGRLPGTPGKKLSYEHKIKFCYCSKIRKKGEEHGRSKLKNSQIYEIRSLIEKKISLSEIARRFDVNYSTISHIKSGRLWSHLI